MSSNAMKSFSTMKKMGLVAGIAAVAISGTQGLKLKLKSGKESKDQSEKQDLSEFKDFNSVNWWNRQEEISPAELIELGLFKTEDELMPVASKMNNAAKKFHVAELWLDNKESLAKINDHQRTCKTKCESDCKHCEEKRTCKEKECKECKHKNKECKSCKRAATSWAQYNDVGHQCGSYRTDCNLTAQQLAQIVKDNGVTKKAYRCQALKNGNFLENKHMYAGKKWLNEEESGQPLWQKDSTRYLSGLSKKIAKQDTNGVFFVSLSSANYKVGNHMFSVEKKNQKCLFVHSFWTFFTAEEWLDEKDTFYERNLAKNLLSTDLYAGDYAHVKYVDDKLERVPAKDNGWPGYLENKYPLFQGGELSPKLDNKEEVLVALGKILENPTKADSRIEEIIKLGKGDLHKPFDCADADAISVETKMKDFMTWLENFTKKAAPSREYEIDQKKTQWRFYEWGSGAKSASK